MTNFGEGIHKSIETTKNNTILIEKSDYFLEKMSQAKKRRHED